MIPSGNTVWDIIANFQVNKHKKFILYIWQIYNHNSVSINKVKIYFPFMYLCRFLDK